MIYVLVAHIFLTLCSSSDLILSAPAAVTGRVAAFRRATGWFHNATFNEIQGKPQGKQYVLIHLLLDLYFGLSPLNAYLDRKSLLDYRHPKQFLREKSKPIWLSANHIEVFTKHFPAHHVPASLFLRFLLSVVVSEHKKTGKMQEREKLSGVGFEPTPLFRDQNTQAMERQESLSLAP